ncbi:hypothetical protein B0H19DRAFT_71036 [Mycena capillaripes]|nr:hypothetical protein B0H19DRAFT_71036 [Mycena capillaripes]
MSSNTLLHERFRQLQFIIQIGQKAVQNLFALRATSASVGPYLSLLQNIIPYEDFSSAHGDQKAVILHRCYKITISTGHLSGQNSGLVLTRSGSVSTQICIPSVINSATCSESRPGIAFCERSSKCRRLPRAEHRPWWSMFTDAPAFSNDGGESLLNTVSISDSSVGRKSGSLVSRERKGSRGRMASPFPYREFDSLKGA